MVCMIAHSVKEPGQKGEAIANAKLISAAPQMLEVLKEIEKEFDRLGRSKCSPLRQFVRSTMTIAGYTEL